MINLDTLIEQANELTPLPATTVRLAQMVGSVDCHLEDMAELIAFDQGLTVKLLRAANSTASASAVPVGTAQEAVFRLGAARVLALTVASGARPFLQTRIPAYGLDEGALWRHSVAAAVAAETAPNFCTVDMPPETFTAALLHDVGKLVMGRFLSPEILDYIRRAQEVDHLGQLAAESLLLNVHHGELGGLVAQHWGLPPRIVQGIIHHHTPDQGLDVICDFTCLANQIAKRIEAGLDGKKFDLTIAPEVMERVGLTSNSLDNFCPIAASRFQQVSRHYNAV